MNNLIEKYKMYGAKKFVVYSISEMYLRLWMQNVRNSYSQKGEDVEIDKLLKHKKKGFYVDVGANHPVRFNNTYRFYKEGWHGINIEPDPENFEKIVKVRSRDVNLNLGVGKKSGELELYQFIPDTLTTFSKDEANRYRSEGYILRGKRKVGVKPLSEIFDEYVRHKKIDFMSVDTEGFDLEVLKSNNWRRYRPKVVCVESRSFSSSPGSVDNRIRSYLIRVGYREYLHTGVNSIYIDKGK